MGKSSNESIENETEQQNPDNKEIEDIQFEEMVDIDQIQKTLEGGDYQTNTEIDLSNLEEIEKSELDTNEDLNPVEEDNKQTKKEPDIIKPQKQTDNAKKYVIYVDPDNVYYIDSLSINERRSVINKILKEQIEISTKTKILNERKKFIKHALLACFTFIIGFPLMFICVNKAMETVISNYQQAKVNFMKLYREKGKVQMENSGQLPNVKY